MFDAVTGVHALVYVGEGELWLCSLWSVID